MGKVAITTLALMLIVLSAMAQESTSPSPTPPIPLESKQTEVEVQKQEQSKRILGVMPQFSVTDRRDAPPLTPKQKFKLFARSTVDPFNFGVLGIQAGISQANNTFPAYGQGAEGYFKRYGAALADSTSSGFFSNFVYPSLLKQDPRYFRSGQGSIKHRIGYCLAQEFIAHKDSGGRTFHFSNVLGAFTAGGISNSYYPPDDRGFGLTMSRSAIALMYGSVGGLLNEFWPDIDRKVLHKSKK